MASASKLMPTLSPRRRPTCATWTWRSKKPKSAPTHHTVSGLAAAEAVLTRQQKEAGTAAVDIGAGTTNLIVFEDGEVQHVAVLPIGGQHITNDLAIGLQDRSRHRRSGQAAARQSRQSPPKPAANVKIGDKTHSFDFDDISMIAEARVEELLEYVDKELQKIKRAAQTARRCRPDWRHAKLPGIDDFAKDKLQLPARIGKLQNVGGLVDTVEDKAFTTVVGLMLLDMLLLPNLPPVHGRGSAPTKALLGGLLNRFKK